MTLKFAKFFPENNQRSSAISPTPIVKVVDIAENDEHVLRNIKGVRLKFDIDQFGGGIKTPNFTLSVSLQ